jgi:hypothetical protein
MPEVKLKKAKSMIEADKIAVGKRGTKPVSRYSNRTGIAKRREITAKISETRLKKRKGRISLKSRIAVPNTRQPS